MRSRRHAREVALQALYQCDTLEDWSTGAVRLFFQTFFPDCAKPLSDSQEENFEFSCRLIDEVVSNLALIDEKIGRASTRWSVNRMARVDRNIIRLAVAEIVFVDEVPTNVTINEAIEIAKRFGTDDSPMFVNGVLDKVARLVRDKTIDSARKSRPITKPFSIKTAA